MITKIIAATKFTDEPQVTLYKDASQLRKLAYSTNEELEAFLRTLERQKKHQYFLVNALGSDEAWGENANGDAFEESELLPKNYKTFETHAKVFKAHRNRPDSKSFGMPRKAFWNPSMHRVELLLDLPEEGNEDLFSKLERGDDGAVSMGCFKAGTLVTMADATRKKIEDIKVGDEVITHLGRVRRVTETFCRPYRGDMYEIVPVAHEEIFATHEHPFYAVPSDAVRWGGAAKGRWIEDSKLDPTWIEAKALGSHFLLEPIFEGTITPDWLDRATARLLGYYLAEGHVLRNKKKEIVGIELSTHMDDAVHAEIAELCRIFDTDNVPVTVHRQPERSPFSRTISIFDRRLANLCYLHCGSYAKKKKLSAEVMFWDSDLQRELLGAFANGDGCGIRSGALQLSTASGDLAWQLVAICHRIGAIASIQNVTHKAGSGFSHHDTHEWTIFIGKTWAQSLRDVCAKIKDAPTMGQRKRNIIGGYVVGKIKRKALHHFEGDVYNLEVEEDHSYMAGGVAVHNCRVREDQCLPAGAPIETSPFASTTIDALKVGDLVRTHLGRLKPVTKVFKRAYSGTLFTLKGSGLNDEITLTPNHPVFAVLGKDIRDCPGGSSHGERRLHAIDAKTGACTYCKTPVDVTPVWRRPDELKVGDYLFYPNFVPPRAHLGVHLSYLLGVAGATGRVNEADSVDVSLWADEPELLNQLIMAVEKIKGAEIKNKVFHSGKLITHRIISKKFSSLFKRFFTKLNDGYESPNDVMLDELGVEDWAWFLAGAFDTNGRVKERTTMRTSNPHFAAMIQKVSWMLGVPCSVDGTFRSRDRSEYRIYPAKDALYGLLKNISTRATEIPIHKMSIRTQMIAPKLNAVLVPVTNIRQEEVSSKTLHNVSVEDDESYISVTVLHNCSWCENLAKTRNEYCDCLKNRLKHVREDGTVCKMLNKEPTFFDISIVNVPADKTAWFLSKVAQEGDDSSYLFDAKNQKYASEVYSRTVFSGFPQVQLDGLMAKHASLPESVRMATIAYENQPEKIALRRKVADITKTLPLSSAKPMSGAEVGDKIKHDGMTELRAKEAELSSPEMDKLAEAFNGNVENLLSTLAAYGVILKPREYQRLALGVSGDDARSLRDRLDAEGTTFEHLDPISSEIQFHPTIDKVDHDVAQAVSPTILAKSYHRGALADRVGHDDAAEDELHGIPEGMEDMEPALARVGGGFQDYSSKAVSFAKEVAPMARFYFPDSNLRIKLEIG